jgi:hypothetical protein
MAINPNPNSSGKVLGKEGKVLGKVGKLSDEPLKYQLFAWLRDNPTIRKRGYLKKAAVELKIPYKEKKELLWRYASEFKTDIRSLPQNGRGSYNRVCSKPDSQHAVFAEVGVPDCLSRVKFYGEVTGLAVEVGWRLSKNVNHNLIWDKEQYTVGRIQWWVNGRVRVHLVNPNKATEPIGLVKQLLYNAFIASGLIADLVISQTFLNDVVWYDAHDVYNYDRPLPYKMITTYKELGMPVIVTGDISHKRGLEVHVIKPDIVTKFERLVDAVNKAFTQSELEKAGMAKILEQNTLAIQGFNSYLAELSKPKSDLKQLGSLYE